MRDRPRSATELTKPKRPASAPAGAADALVGELPRRAAEIIERLRQRRPKVHCITNAVAQTFTANTLLAAGCVPSMSLAPDEVAHFVAGADALLVNLGTFDAQRREAVELAVAAAAEHRVPWVLDPVFVDRSRPRTDYARSLLQRKPTSIRLNHAEFTALSGLAAQAEAVADFAQQTSGIVGLTGDVDLVTDGARRVRIDNGDPMMGRVTAMGCAGSALVAACLAVEDDALVATAAGLILLGLAGEIAALHAAGPGSFAPEILDAIFLLDRDSLLERARVS